MTDHSDKYDNSRPVDPTADTTGTPFDYDSTAPSSPTEAYPTAGPYTPYNPTQPYPTSQGYDAPQYGQPSYGAPGTGPNYQSYGTSAQPQYPYGYPQYGYQPNDPTAPYGRHPLTGEPLSDKQKVTAGLLEIFLGAFGAGRFYLDQPGIAIAQIAVTWLTCGIGGIWPLIDGIMMLTGNVRDKYGRPLRD
ncbi:TM2 domain-containing protein [Skermania sp. ID1734]|uniref:TM2 domain-containing protein n=1 Tax=Skermania sp. ID1734 TaxID=2597516 RepID=UPI00117C2E44|nr:TM2 domain-containing protein [Skermania sp. ID1734]